MEIGELLDLETERMSFGPAAVARHRPSGEERAVVVFVEGAAPREAIRARLTRRHKNYWEAELVEVLRPSPDRVVPPCPVFGRCGGCQWQHLSYPAQLRAKEEILLHQIERATRIPQNELKTKLSVHGAKSQYGYRARLQARGDRQGLGFFAPGSHTIVHTQECLVADPAIREAWSELLETGKHAELAAPTGQFKIEWTKAGTQVHQAVNREHGALGFTQINPEQNQVLVDVVTELARGAPGRGMLLDLYSGDGNLSEKLVADFGRTVCVDEHTGQDPAEIKNLPEKGRVFVRSGVEEFLRDGYLQSWLESASASGVGCAITDPPRNGLREVASRVAGLRTPRIILVSCDPATLARDLTAFTSSGGADYRIDEIHLIDMFPQTFHLETVVGLSLQG